MQTWCCRAHERIKPAREPLKAVEAFRSNIRSWSTVLSEVGSVAEPAVSVRGVATEDRDTSVRSCEEDGDDRDDGEGVDFDKSILPR